MEPFYITPINDAVAHYTSIFENNRTAIEQHSAPSLNALRKSAIAFFKEQGIPNKTNELYKYTDLTPVFGRDFNSQNNKIPTLDLNAVFHCNVPELNAYFVTMINGRYHSDNQLTELQLKGIIVCSLNEAAEKYPDLFQQHYGKYTNYQQSVVALNTAFAQDGLFIYIPKGQVIEKPIQIVSLLQTEEHLMIQPRNLIIVESNSEVRIIQCDHTITPHQYLSNTVTEVIVGENAIFDFYNLQDEHNWSSRIHSVFIHQLKQSNVLTSTITLNGGFIRNNLYISHQGIGCETQATGILLADLEQHIDNYVSIAHKFPNCYSNQLFRSILGHHSKGVFTGRIYVEKNAQKTQAFQSNNNVLLSETAKMHTRPQLEIYADDVKCSHGATVGQINEDALFYLRARGISKEEARLMLMYAFSHEVIKKIRVEALRERVAELVERRLRGELTRCASCMLNCK